MSKDEFGGDKKAPMTSPLAKIERKFIDANVGKWPSWIETYHLTMLTVPWSILTVVSGYLAQQNLHWLWLSSAMLFLQWFTDAFDGSLGKHRDTGLIKWGYFMDHFLDFIFISAVVLSYTFLLEDTAKTIMILLIPLMGAFWVNAFLSFSVTNVFEITHFGTGPTEIRIFFILLNTAIIFAGPGFLVTALPYALVVILCVLTILVYKSHRRIWAIDMAAKAEKKSNQDNG